MALSIHRSREPISLRKLFSASKNDDATQRNTIWTSRQRVTRRVLRRTPSGGLSMMLVVAKQRCSGGGNAQTIDGKAFLNAFSQAGRRLRPVPLQPLRTAALNYQLRLGQPRGYDVIQGCQSDQAESCI